MGKSNILYFNASLTIKEFLGYFEYEFEKYRINYFFGIYSKLYGSHQTHALAKTNTAKPRAPAAACLQPGYHDMHLTGCHLPCSQVKSSCW